MSIKTKQTKKLLEHAEILDKSVKAWEKMMLDWGSKIDNLPLNHTIDELKALEKELSLLVARGEMEVRNLEKWEEERIKICQKSN